WLRRKTSQEIADSLMGLEISGLGVVHESARRYLSNTAAQLIGTVGIDNNGLTGLEHHFDATLKGRSQILQSFSDGRGHAIFLEDPSQKNAQSEGETIRLTIDRVIQEITERELLEGARAAQAKHAFAIVGDPYTGQLLAVANYPPFDPQEPSI